MPARASARHRRRFGAVRPNPNVAGTSIAFAGESAYAEVPADLYDIHRERAGFRHYAEPFPA